jgi:4-amino-4-deoxy-L-arabinose transferase-like glycosyltransferase
MGIMKPVSSQHYRVALLLALVYMLLLILAQMQTGVTRDEGYYFKAAHEYSGWFKQLVEEPSKAFSAQAIDKHWSYNHEHPVLMKTLFAASYSLFHEVLGWTSEITAMRLPGIAMSALGVALTFLLGVGWCGVRTGLLAALFLAFQPRYFYHGQLACFDAAVITMWLAVTLAWLYREDHHLRLGLVFGLAMATKHNVLFFPILLLLHWLWLHREALLRGYRPASVDGAHGFALPVIPWWVLAMGLIGPLVFLLHWPYLWPAPLERIGFYLNFHLHHEHYPVRYFGAGLWEPPFPITFPLVMSALTLSLPLVVACCGGFFEQSRQMLHRLWWGSSDRHDKGAFLLLNLCIPVLLIAAPSVPIFGGTKHWMNALPFAALLAALFCAPILAHLAKLRPWAPALTIALLVLPGAVTTARAHPHGIAAYSELAFGLRGAAALGMQRQFWGGGLRPLLATINAEAKQGAKIFGDRMNEDSFKAYQRDGILRADLRFTLHMSRAQWWFTFHQPDSDWVLSAIRSRVDARLVAVADREGVTIVSLYRREGN